MLLSLLMMLWVRLLDSEVLSKRDGRATIRIEDAVSGIEHGTIHAVPRATAVIPTYTSEIRPEGRRPRMSCAVPDVHCVTIIAHGRAGEVRAHRNLVAQRAQARRNVVSQGTLGNLANNCLLYTCDAADE